MPHLILWLNIYFCPTTKVWNLGDLTNKFWVLTMEKTEQGKRMEIVAAMQCFTHTYHQPLECRVDWF